MVVQGGGGGTSPASVQFVLHEVQKPICPTCPCPTYSIGQYAQGGVIIWLTDDGQHGLVAALSDVSIQGAGTTQTTFAWALWNSYYSLHVTGATNDETSLPQSYTIAPAALNYAGGQNQAILNNLNAYPGLGTQNQLEAAYNAQLYTYTDDAGVTYEDWFLPSVFELHQMYLCKDTINTVAQAHGGSLLRTDTFYWSSREVSDDFAWFLSFADGGQYFAIKDESCAVRCVRAF